MASKTKDLWGGAAGDAGWAVLVAPAPGDLRIVQAMVNTASSTARTDELASPQAAAVWLARWGLLPAAMEISETDHRRLVDARDGLRALTRFNGGLPWDADAVARLNKAAASAPLKVELGARSTRLEPAFDGVDGALGILARIVVAARLEAVWRRLKLCRGDDCGLSFYDASARCLRRWCSMERCGNFAKSQTFQRRHPRAPR